MLFTYFENKHWKYLQNGTRQSDFERIFDPLGSTTVFCTYGKNVILDFSGKWKIVTISEKVFPPL